MSRFPIDVGEGIERLEEMLEMLAIKPLDESQKMLISGFFAGSLARFSIAGYIDGHGNFEKTMQDWMTDEPNIKWVPVWRLLP
jgi:hypothetical protein